MVLKRGYPWKFLFMIHGISPLISVALATLSTTDIHVKAWLSMVNFNEISMVHHGYPRRIFHAAWISVVSVHGYDHGYDHGLDHGFDHGSFDQGSSNELGN